MRVIAGSAKGRKLEAPDGIGTRPTADRFKEMLFAVLQFRIPEAGFLDLFSGSGSIGIEALSRGAAKAVMVEADPEAVRCIRRNIEHTGLSDGSRIMELEAAPAISRLAGEGEVFDLIFMDPPYAKGWEIRTADQIRQEGILAPEGWLIIESSSETEVRPVGWTVVKEKIHKITKFTFLRLSDPEMI